MRKDAAVEKRSFRIWITSVVPAMAGRAARIFIGNIIRSLKDTGLPDIRWHDLRSTFCTLLLKNDFSPKAVSKLMGHAKEIISVDVYGDNANIIPDEIPEFVEFMDEVLPKETEGEGDKLLGIVTDTSYYIT